MGNRFFEHPILNSPYEYPPRHWEMDASGQPTQQERVEDIDDVAILREVMNTVGKEGRLGSDTRPDDEGWT